MHCRHLCQTAGQQATTAACGYTELWNAFKRITAGASAAEKMALFSGTAARVYRLTAT